MTKHSTMKKIITLCFFAFAMFLGTDTANAQSNKIEINAVAAEKTEALRQHIKFNDDQRDKVYLALQEYTQSSVDLANANIDNEEAVEKIELLLVNKMKEILTQEQFERYKTFQEE